MLRNWSLYAKVSLLTNTGYLASYSQLSWTIAPVLPLVKKNDRQFLAICFLVHLAFPMGSTGAKAWAKTYWQLQSIYLQAGFTCYLLSRLSTPCGTVCYYDIQSKSTWRFWRQKMLTEYLQCFLMSVGIKLRDNHALFLANFCQRLWKITSEWQEQAVYTAYVTILWCRMQALSAYAVACLHGRDPSFQGSCIWWLDTFAPYIFIINRNFWQNLQ